MTTGWRGRISVVAIASVGVVSCSAMKISRNTALQIGVSRAIELGLCDAGGEKARCVNLDLVSGVYEETNGEVFVVFVHRNIGMGGGLRIRVDARTGAILDIEADL